MTDAYCLELAAACEEGNEEACTAADADCAKDELTCDELAVGCEEGKEEACVMFEASCG